MRFKTFWRFFFVAVLSLPAIAQESTNRDGARGVRPANKTVEKFVRTRNQPKPTNKTGKTGSPRNEALSRLGIGLTIYQQDATGHWSAADPGRTFRDGDRVRFLIETNSSGYLYLFNSANQGSPVMIFPAGDLNNGRNAVKAHVPYEIPAEPPYFEFKGEAGTERIFILLARQPLANVLREQALVDYCRRKQRQDPPEDCVWEPSAVEWERIQAGSQAEWIGAQKNTIGQPQPQAMQSAVNRGVHPAQRAPAPTLVRMRAFPKAAKILLAVDLKHAR